MSTADKSGEASMDEILASIRKIIADDPVENSSTEPPRPVFPRLDSVDLRPRPSVNTGDGRPLPPADRFAGTLRPQPPMLSSGSKTEPPVTSAFNFGLDDLLDETPVKIAVAKPVSGPPAVPKLPISEVRSVAPGPNIGAANEAPKVNSTASVKAEASPAEAAAASTAPEFKPDFKPAFDPATPAAPPAVTETADAGAANDPWGAWRSLRLNAQAEPARPPDPAPVTPRIENAPPKRGFYPPAGPTLKPGPTPSFSNVFPRTAGTVAPGQTPAAPVAPPLAEAAIKPSANGIDQAALNKSVEVISSAAKTDGSIKLNGSVPKPVESKPVDSVSAAKVERPVDSVTDTGAKTITAAANQALDHLAAGLAAATLAPAPSASSSSSQTSAQSVQPVAGQPGGPLESIVADMLRPMLEKWIEANMPRILQKALTEPGKTDGQH